MRAGAIGMVLDRALTPKLLDVALRVATEHEGASDARRLLTVALRDHVSAQEAEGKTKKCLSRVWVSPPAPAREMIRWAIDRQADAGDRRAMHFTAILATFPFVGSVAAIAGRQLHLDNQVDARRVKAEARTALGDRSTIDVGARKVLTTMRYLGILGGPGVGPLAVDQQPALSSTFAGWLLHALLLTRQADSIGIDEISRAFELAGMKRPRPLRGYPLLEIHREARGTVAVPRATTPERPPSPWLNDGQASQNQLEFDAS